MLQCIVAKAALYAIWNDIQAAAGPYRLCAEQITGTKAAVYAISFRIHIYLIIMIVMPFY